MARVSLLFEDAEDGQIDFRADYHGGFDATANSHKLANQVIMFLDEQAAKKEKVVVTTIGSPEEVSDHERLTR